MGTETPLDPGWVQNVELVHGVTKNGLVCDTLYEVAFGGQEFAVKLGLAKHAISDLLNDKPHHGVFISSWDGLLIKDLLPQYFFARDPPGLR